jgi:hypothetical protein
VPGSRHPLGAAVPRPRARAAALLLVALALAILAGVRAPLAHAGAGQEAMLQDDLLLLYSGPEARESALDEIQKIGVDTVRAFVSWNSLAPGATSRSRPAFDGANPASYPAGAWDRYDELARSATRRGLRVLFTPNGPNPAWGSDCPGSVVRRRTCSPNPTEFGRFVAALGRRYSGGYVDENGGGALPRVSRWAIWNEPNVAIWMTPQYVVRGGRRVPESARRYRLLVRAAVASLRATGHGGDVIIAGETGPIGQTGGSLLRRPVATAEFLRALFCVTPRGGPLRSAAIGCAGGYAPLGITAVSHHPYIQGGSRTPRTPARFDEITISSPSRLKAIMNSAARLGRIRPGLPIYYTEFGFQTDPPDELLGVQLGLQPVYLAESLYMTFGDPRVRGLAQYLLRDDSGIQGFQSGLRFADGDAKPSLRDYPFPIFAARRGAVVTVFGQVRVAPDGARIPVQVQFRARGARQFTTVRTVITNHKGFVLARIRSRTGTWRLVAPSVPGGRDGGLTSRESQEAIR